jgi:hypothetical protein
MQSYEVTVLLDFGGQSKQSNHNFYISSVHPYNKMYNGTAMFIHHSFDGKLGGGRNDRQLQDGVRYLREKGFKTEKHYTVSNSVLDFVLSSKIEVLIFDPLCRTVFEIIKQNRIVKCDLLYGGFLELVGSVRSPTSPNKDTPIILYSRLVKPENVEEIKKNERYLLISKHKKEGGLTCHIPHEASRYQNALEEFKKAGVIFVPYLHENIQKTYLRLPELKISKSELKKLEGLGAHLLSTKYDWIPLPEGEGEYKLIKAFFSEGDESCRETANFLREYKMDYKDFEIWGEPHIVFEFQRTDAGIAAFKKTIDRLVNQIQKGDINSRRSP